MNKTLKKSMQSILKIVGGHVHFQIIVVAEWSMFNYYGNKWKKKRKRILRIDGYV